MAVSLRTGCITAYGCETKANLDLFAQRPFHLHDTLFELPDDGPSWHTLATEEKNTRHTDENTLADREVPSQQTSSQAQAAATRKYSPQTFL